MKLDSNLSAIVTGGASGLGEATARMLADQRIRVSIFDLQREKGEKVAREIGGKFFEVDVASEASVDAALLGARAAHGVERILVNCAGIAPGRRIISRKRDSNELVAHDLLTFQKTVAVNLVGTFHMIAKSTVAMAALTPLDADGQRGVVITTSSVAAEDGQIGQAAYTASKAGIMGMTLPIARDLASFGIRIMTILPGIFYTPLMDGLSEAVRNSLPANVPFPARLGRADEYAHLVKSICENDMLNGGAIRIDGALRMPPK